MATTTIFQLTIITTILIIIISSLPISLSQQNIQTTYPFSLPLPPVFSPPPPVDNPVSVPLPPTTQPPPTTSSPPSTRAAVGRAIGITAASTLVLSALLFFLLLQRSRRKRARDGTVLHPPPVDSNNINNNNTQFPVFRPQDENFVRVDGNIKGVIVDEDGLDVLYWRKLEEGSIRESFKKQEYKKLRDENDHDHEGEKRTVSGKGKRFDPPVQELPLLRGKSSTSQSPLWVDNNRQDSGQFNRPPIGSFKAVERQGSVVEMAKMSTTLPPVPPPPPRLPPPVALAAVSKEKPPPKGPAPPPPPPPNSTAAVPASIPRAPMPSKSSSEGESSKGDGQVKLKPLHWDKVNPNMKHSMVWDKLDKGSFQFDGDLMEALFGTVATSRKSPRGDTPTGDKSGPPLPIFILDTKKSQNTAIVLKSLGISHREIIDALIEGRGLDADTLEKLARIAPSDEEVSQILAFDGDPTRLADAESFLYHLLKTVPSAFIRFNAMSFRSNYDSEVTHVKESLQSLESACNELRTRGLFLKLLEAVLKAGNRLNAGTSRGNAQAFNLTALRKLSDVKSSDGKTTLLQFVVQEVVRAEGKRCVLNRSRSMSRTSSRNVGSGNQNSDNSVSKDEREKEYMMLGLPVIGGLSGEFTNVKKAAVLDYDLLVKTISSLAVQVNETRRVVEQEEGGFAREMNAFLDTAKLEIGVVKEEQTRVMELVRKTRDYYQAGSSKDRGANTNQFQLFVIVRDFLGMVDKVCIDIARDVQNRKPVNNTSNVAGSSSSSQSPPESPRVFRFPKLPANFMSDSSKSSSSDSDNESTNTR